MAPILGSPRDERSGPWVLVAGGLLAVPLLAGCASKAAPSPAPAPITLDERSERVARALERGDGAAVASAMRDGAPVRIEIRQVLTETDERAVTHAPDRTALRNWVEGTSAELRCDGGCRWPGGLVVGGPWTCSGQCCRLPRASMTEGTLHVVRLCFAAGGGGEASLSLLELAEAR